MKVRKLMFLLMTHTSVLIIGIALGIYLLPIITAPLSPTELEIKAISQDVLYKAKFTRKLEGSDLLHWGEGEISLGTQYISMLGELAPGPEYKLYLSPKFVQTEIEFEQLKSQMILVGDINTFNNFVVKVNPNVTLSQFTTVVVWCEAFGEFITAAKYR